MAVTICFGHCVTIVSFTSHEAVRGGSCATGSTHMQAALHPDIFSKQGQQILTLCEGVSEHLSVCLCVQAVQQDHRVTQLVTDLNSSIQAAAEESDSGDSIPAVLVLNKVGIPVLYHPSHQHSCCWDLCLLHMLV